MTQVYTLPATVNLIQHEGQIDILEVMRPQCRAKVSLLGGQVLSYMANDEEDVFWQNPDICLDGSSAIRQGVPVCWPWFGVLDCNPAAVADNFQQHQPNAPSHGLVRNRLWTLEQVTETEHATQLILCTELVEEQLLLRITYHFSDKLGIKLSSENRSDRTRHLSFALHSYFAISDIGTVHIDELANHHYVDGLDDFSEQQQQDAVRFQGETDRIYLDTPPVIRLQDEGWRRAICLEAADSHSAVVWNPWVEKGKRLSQFPDNGYEQMLCIETARAWHDSLELPAHSEYTLELTIWVEQLG